MKRDTAGGIAAPEYRFEAFGTDAPGTRWIRGLAYPAGMTQAQMRDGQTAIRSVVLAVRCAQCKRVYTGEQPFDVCPGCGK